MIWSSVPFIWLSGGCVKRIYTRGERDQGFQGKRLVGILEMTLCHILFILLCYGLIKCPDKIDVIIFPFKRQFIVSGSM